VEFYHPEDGGEMFSKMLVVTKATWCDTPEDISHCYCHENIPEDSVLWPYIDVVLIQVNSEHALLEYCNMDSSLECHPQLHGIMSQNIELLVKVVGTTLL
jgi:hypothetical protein